MWHIVLVLCVAHCVCVLHTVLVLCVAHCVSVCMLHTVRVFVCCTLCVIVQLLILFYNYYTFHSKESVSFWPFGHKTSKYNFFSCTPKLPNENEVFI